MPELPLFSASGWTDFDLSVAVLIFIAYAGTDFLYAKYTVTVIDLEPGRAATTGALIHVLLAFGVISYTQNIFYVLPLVAGSWIGTYIYVYEERRRRKKAL